MPSQESLKIIEKHTRIPLIISEVQFMYKFCLNMHMQVAKLRISYCFSWLFNITMCLTMTPCRNWCDQQAHANRYFARHDGPAHHQWSCSHAYRHFGFDHICFMSCRLVSFKALNNPCVVVLYRKAFLLFSLSVRAYEWVSSLNIEFLLVK